ncbi:family 43 glycosylhydrolase [Spirochaeta cellobiosiphila]|uniref:family 43 glycosylhydrolase n=1 Tax=Spirochaeta cellobiosiphila TaxID=504483 RepID=UPI000421D7F9|nr:family 43 glycosylhydrolase [Spirochaeta cellobiosiphila]
MTNQNTLNQSVNPFLPSYEYIPDGEPYVFGDRVYLYGSHDRFGGSIFCLNDYVCYSAPVDDLGNWTNEGVIYRKNQDPRNRHGLNLLFAPDVVYGKDKRYYLYYTLGFSGIMGVAVSDIPQGPFHFHGHVSHKDGTLWGRRKNDYLPFDPAVFIDKGQVYLYSGFAKYIPSFLTGFVPLKCKGGTVLTLENDMLTIKEEPQLIFPSDGVDSFQGHEFFEASSIRKINNKYYFVYSSVHNHELCWAYSDYPNKDYLFGGVLVSLGDINLNDIDREKKGLNYLGNTHGGLLNIKDKWYIFYHRHTNRHSYSRQACAEEIIFKDGHFLQAPLSSCGLNGKPLSGQGYYESRIACHLRSSKGVARYDKPLRKIFLYDHPYITQSGKDREDTPDQFIANIRDGSSVGFKFFTFQGLHSVSVKIRGKASGNLILSTSLAKGKPITIIPVNIQNQKRWVTIMVSSQNLEGVYPLYFFYEGTGAIDFKSFILYD